MNSMIRTATLGLCLLSCSVAYAEDKIGVIAPLSGSFARLGAQLVDGATIAVAANKNGQPISIIAADDKCDAAGGTAAAKQMVQANVMIVVGFLCAESLEAALPILSQKGIPVITPGVRSQTLTELRADQPYPVFRVAPSDHNEANETGDILTELWHSTPFAIIDDGTIFGRELASGVRARLEEKGLKPVFTDTYRPGLDNQNALVGRLKRAGATQVFVGGERDDVAAIGRSAHNAKNAIELAGKVPEGYTVPAYAAAEAAIQVLTAAQSQAGSLTELLHKNVFETALGSVQFDARGERIADTYRLQKYDGSQFVLETN
jgi:branched-chain amino acid transport system substrate-binding protein